MISRSGLSEERRRHDPTLVERYRAGHPRPLAQGTFRSLGLGLITGASDDDPSGIGTYSQIGAQFGYGMLWTMVVSYPLMSAYQESVRG